MVRQPPFTSFALASGERDPDATTIAIRSQS